MLLNEVVYLLVILSELAFLVWISMYLLLLIYSWLHGAPYVATRIQQIDSILQKAHLKENQIFYELGCGDGRVIRRATKLFKIKGLGVDINPWVIVKARILSKIHNTTNVSFKILKISDVDLKQADIIYLFLFPKLVETIRTNLISKTKNNVLIISHGFRVDYLNEYLVDELKESKFSTYYYRIKRYTLRT